VPTYMVERYLPGVSAEEILAAAIRAREVTADMTDKGSPIRYLRSTYLPSEESCFCLFDGPSEEAVRAANDRARIPFDRIVEAVHMASEDLGQ
jgi:uncharacterized protein DUF4242